MENTQREGYINRHTNGLPDHECNIKVIIQHIGGEKEYLCKWSPKVGVSDPERYLGTAKVIEGKYAGIGYHAWKGVDTEFVFYAVVETEEVTPVFLHRRRY